MQAQSESNLYHLPKLLERAINHKPACARDVAGKNLAFQIQTLDRIGRHFCIQHGSEAFLAALHDEDLVISGDFVEVRWFQGGTEHLQPAR